MVQLLHKYACCLFSYAVAQLYIYIYIYIYKFESQSISSFFQQDLGWIAPISQFPDMYKQVKYNRLVLYIFFDYLNMCFK